MDFQNDNAAAAANFGRSRDAALNFLLNLREQQVSRPRVQAETELTRTQNKAAAAEAERQKQTFDLLTLPRLKAMKGLYDGVTTPGAIQDTGADAAPVDPEAEGVPAGPDFAGTPSFSGVPPISLGEGIRPHVWKPGTELGTTTPPAAAPTAPERRYQVKIGKDGAPEVVDQTGLTRSMSDFVNQHPDQIGLLAPEFQEMAQKQLEAAGKAITNKKAAADTAQSLETELYGTSDERRAHSEFTRNAAQLSHRLNEYYDTVSKVGNFEWADPDGAAKLSSLPLDISDNFSKITNPGGMLREGLVDLGKELQIPTANDHWYGAIGFGPRNATTLAAITQTKNVLADYIRQYENLPTTKAPVAGLTPEIRQLVGETTAAKNYAEKYGKPVPVDEGKFNVKLGVGDKVTAPGSAPQVTSKADYDKLPAGAWYQDAEGLKQKGGGQVSAPAAKASGTNSTSIFPETAIKRNISASIDHLLHAPKP